MNTKTKLLTNKTKRMKKLTTEETKKLESLTAEQEALIPIFRQKWLDCFYGSQELNKELAEKQIKWLYKLTEKPEPKILFMDSPIGCQVLIQHLKNPNAPISFDIKEFEPKCFYGDVADMGWVSMYDLIQECGLFSDYDWDNFNGFKSLLESGIYEFYPFENYCIVSAKPKVYQDDKQRLHCGDGASVIFKDGFEIYYWHGINVPEEWIKDKTTITRDMILTEQNVEQRRCMQEIVGNERYMELLDVIELDKDIDDKGFPMSLLRTKEKDNIINEYIYFYKCICPSTQRQYVQCIPSEPVESKTVKNVWDAKAWTFRNEKIQIRHGDVGFVNLDQDFEKPTMES